MPRTGPRGASLWGFAEVARGPRACGGLARRGRDGAFHPRRHLSLEHVDSICPCDSRKSQHPAEPDEPEEPTANRLHRVSLGPAPTTQPEVRALDEAIQSR